MNGPEHYREAERLLAQALKVTELGQVTEYGTGIDSDLVAAAQVHATLALTAATALHTVSGRSHLEEVRQWESVLSLGYRVDVAAETEGDAAE